MRYFQPDPGCLMTNLSKPKAKVHESKKKSERDVRVDGPEIEPVMADENEFPDESFGSELEMFGSGKINSYDRIPRDEPMMPEEHVQVYEDHALRDGIPIVPICHLDLLEKVPDKEVEGSVDEKTYVGLRGPIREKTQHDYIVESNDGKSDFGSRASIESKSILNQLETNHENDESPEGEVEFQASLDQNLTNAKEGVKDGIIDSVDSVITSSNLSSSMSAPRLTVDDESETHIHNLDLISNVEIEPVIKEPTNASVVDFKTAAKRESSGAIESPLINTQSKPLISPSRGVHEGIGTTELTSSQLSSTAQIQTPIAGEEINITDPSTAS